MAFNINDWDTIGSQPNATGAAPGLFRYGSTSDSLATIQGSDYFSVVKNSLQVDDQIYVNSTTSPAGKQWLRVTQVSPTVETVKSVDRLLDGDAVANCDVNPDPCGCIPLLYRFELDSGADTQGVTVNKATFIMDVSVVLNGAGTADTVTGRSGGVAFTDAMSINVANNDVVRASKLFTATWAVNANTVLDFVKTGGPPVVVNALGARIP